MSSFTALTECFHTRRLLLSLAASGRTSQIILGYGINVYRFNAHVQGDNAYNLENGIQSALTNSGHWAVGVAYCSFLDVFTTNHPWILWGVGVYVKFRQRWGWAFTWTWAFVRMDSVYIPVICCMCFQIN